MKRRSKKSVRRLAASLTRLLPVRQVEDTRAPALPPDTLVHVGEQKTQKTSLQVVDFCPGGIRELNTPSIEECRKFEDKETLTWIRVTGLHEVEKISSLLDAYDIHRLLQSDILNTRQRPKVESIDDYVFVVLKSISTRAESTSLVVENFSIIYAGNVVISFEESPSTIFDPIFARLRTPNSRIQRSGGDYLMWALLDAMVDHYFVALAGIEDEVDKFDDLISTHPDDIDPFTIHSLKQQVYHLNRLMRPAREVVTVFSRSESKLIAETTRAYYRDLYDHVIHAIEIAENLRESCASLRDYYLASVSNRMNEVMKVLTCFASIFLPLTFLAGIYGMNFEHMPELGFRWSYAILWSVFLVLAALMFVFFRRRRWL